MYQLPLKFIRVSPNLSICATRIVAMISTKSLQARKIMQEEKAKGTFINGAAREKTQTIIILDNGTVIGSPMRIKYLLSGIAKSNNSVTKLEKFRQTKRFTVYDVADADPDLDANEDIPDGLDVLDLEYSDEYDDSIEAGEDIEEEEEFDEDEFEGEEVDPYANN